MLGWNPVGPEYSGANPYVVGLTLGDIEGPCVLLFLFKTDLSVADGSGSHYVRLRSEGLGGSIYVNV